MLKLSLKTALAAALAAVALPASAQAAIGPDAAACARGGGPTGSAILVNVNGFRERAGRIRVNVYGGDAARFLGRGQYIRQIELPVTRSGPMAICVAVPGAGRYAVAVRHDHDGDGNDWQDGGGFSRNPRVSLMNLRPSYNNVAFNVTRGVAGVNVTLLYRYGLSIRPVA